MKPWNWRIVIHRRIPFALCRDRCSEYHAEIVRQIIDFNLTAKQIKELCEGDGLQADEADPLDKLPPIAVKMEKFTQSVSSLTAQDLARALMMQEADTALRVRVCKRCVS